MGESRSILPALALFIGLGCSRGVVKGPVGQGEQGVGLKIPVLGLLEKDAYDPSNFNPDNLDSEEINPFRGRSDLDPDRDAFSRYTDE